MKLYELRTGQLFRVVADNKAPPAAREIAADEVLKFGHVDGMYSFCHDIAGGIVHPVAWAEVEVLE